VTPEEVGASLKVSRETTVCLTQYVERLKKWNPHINLVSPRSLDEVWTRHVLDSGQLLDLAPETARAWWDLGSGGGLPAMIVAILARERRPALHVSAVESDTRKCAFLSETARELGLDLTVKRTRIERLNGPVADVLTARALASLDRLLAYANDLLNPGGVAIFPKGAGAERELTDARNRWHYDYARVESVTDDRAAIFCFTEIRCAGRG